MVLKASSPVRHLSFSPSASQPFTLLAACASGTLIRYDVRYISKQNGGATDRVAGMVFEISDEELANADKYEVADYKRVAAPLASGRTAWVYVDARA